MSVVFSIRHPDGRKTSARFYQRASWRMPAIFSCAASGNFSQGTSLINGEHNVISKNVIELLRHRRDIPSLLLAV
jgi:hypothetical protein